jgi:WD40 repeat protein
VLASRKAATKRQRITLSAVAFGMIVAVGLSVVAYFQHRESTRQQQIALGRQLINQAEALRASPNQFDNHLEKSACAAVQALALFDGMGMHSVEADESLRKSMALLPKLASEHELNLSEIRTSAFDPTGRFLAVANRFRVLIWDNLQERNVASLSNEISAMASILAVAINTNASYIATSVYDASREIDASTVTVWQLPEGTSRNHFQRKGRLEKVYLSPQGDYVYALGNGKLWGWNILTGKELEPLAEAQSFYAMAFSPDGQRVAIAFRKAGTGDRIIRILDVVTGEEKERWVQRGYIVSLAWSANSKRVLAITQDGILSRELITGIESIYRLNGSAFALSPNQRFVAESGSNYTVRIRTPTGREHLRLIHNAEVKAAAFRSGTDSIVTLSGSKLKVWDLGGSRAYAELSDKDPIDRVAFGSNATLMFTGSASLQRRWKLPPREKGLEHLQEYKGAESIPELSSYRAQASGRFPPDGTNHVEIFNSKEERFWRHEFSANALAAAISDDGRRLAITTGDITRGGWQLKLETWDLVHNKRLGAVPCSQLEGDDSATFLVISPEGRFVGTASRERLTVWDVITLEQVATLYHSSPRAVAFQPQGKLIATAGQDQIIRIWELTSRGKSSTVLEVARIEETDPIKGLALSSDGRWLAGVDIDGTARLWLLQPADVIAQARARIRIPCP